ncbi:MAG: DNA-directed RNA polymerase subunit beta [Spirochaetaceae bacterium]|nr:DNA-directed RNA polymerase subunit beta [Spirochaetaceae bacterium]
MPGTLTKVPRQFLGRGSDDVMAMPNLVDIQISSYERLLQRERLRDGEAPERQGLEEVFRDVFPIESPNGDMVLEYAGYSLDEANIKFSESACKTKGLTYAIPIKARINLVFLQTGEIRQKEIYMGDIPLMTERGTFIINGAERVVVSQIHRSPGAIFSHEKGVYASRIIPYRGSWLEFEIDQKKELIYAKIDRKKRLLATVFLRALGFDSREAIVDLFYRRTTMPVSADPEAKSQLVGKILSRPVHRDDTRLYRAGEKLLSHDVEELANLQVPEVEVIDSDHPDSLHSPIVINCFEREETRLVPSDEDDELTREDAVIRVYSAIKPGEPVTIESAEKDLHSMFFSSRRYDLGRVGRYKLNKKFDYAEPPETHTLVPEDIVNTMIMLTKVYIGEGNVDDIDHLGNRRIRSVGELLTNHLKIAFSRMERIAKERMSLKEADTIRPQDLVSIKPIVATIKEFFGSSQLSQFMEQVNPLAELTHKRRLNALGPGGLSRDRAGFEVRDVHYTHYGRMCPIETPEGPNIGLIVSLANYTRVNSYGFLETPYRKVIDGRVTREIEYLSAIDEEKYFIAQAGAPVDDDGQFTETLVPVRRGGDYITREPDSIQYMDVSPKQIISVSASLIPFLEHDDANRALMGSNMQRQAVPLIIPEPPRVGTGMEEKTAYDSGVLVLTRRAGVVEYVSSQRVEIRPDGAADGEIDTYPMVKYQRTNQDTCFLQKPVCAVGDRVEAGQVLADGPSTYAGELALGRNVIVAFMPWNGYNYEDAILVSSRVVKEDVFTSIHIKEFSIEVRETKLGPEKITRDIPNTAEDAFEHLDAEGIVRIGAKVKSGSILVGKVTPKSETDSTPEFKLLNSIFGEKAKEVRDTSLRIQHGVEGTVIDVQRMRRSAGDELSPGVEEVVKVLVASKRKLQEGDKMAGRHGNKGVIARVLPVEDMPFMADGTAVDVVLNPLGVPSRMNLGQIMETQLGWAGLRLDEWYATPVFQSASNDMIEDKLSQAELPSSSKITLYDGLTGEPFENPVTCGVIYMMKLSHLVDDKMHSRSTGPYSLVTQQPLGGKAQNGGQRLGEMEVWALEAYGAANTLRELLTVKSDDMNGRAKVYESIVKGEPFESGGIPESFNVLVQELRGLALDITIFDGKGKPVPLTERDEELITREGARF